MATTFATETWVAGLRTAGSSPWFRHGIRAVTLGLLLLVAGDRSALMATSCGIDPLEILKSQVKHNVLVLFDTSGSMNWPPTIPPGRLRQSFGADDPETRMWQAKQATRDVVQDYTGRINFGILTFPNSNTLKPLNEGVDFNGVNTPGGGALADGPFIYVSNDPGARRFAWDPDGDNVESPFQTPVAVNGSGNIQTCVAPIGSGQCTIAATSTIVCGVGTNNPFGVAAPTPPGFGSLAAGDVISVDRGGGVVDTVQVTIKNSNHCVTVAAAQSWAAGFPFRWSKTRPTLGFFGNLGRQQDPTTWDNNSPGPLDINTRIDVFRSFGNVGYAVPYPYLSHAWDMTPAGVINSWPQSDAPSFPEGNTSPGFNQWRKPLCNPLNRECKYYLQSRVFRSSRSYRWNTSPAAPNGAANRLISVTPFVCPPVTPAPVGQELVDQLELNRPCIQFVDNASGESAVFYYSSASFQTQGGVGCTGTPHNIANVSSCTGNNVPLVVDSMELGLPLDPAAPVDNKLMGLPTANQNPAPNVMNGSTNPVPALSGVRPTESTPIATGLRSIRTGPGGPYYPVSPPLPPGVVQKNFVLILTDGNNNCNNNTPDPAAEARLLFNNPPGVRQAETLLVAYAPDAGVDEANFIARAGSGGVLSTCPPGYQPANCSGCSFTCYTCPPGSLTCRDAFRADSVEDLKEQLKTALDVIQQQGEFSATQNIAATVFELSNPAGNPPADPLDPQSRYNQRINTLYESTFEVLGWQGRLKAFKNDGTFAPVTVPPGTAAVGTANWEAGKTLFYQVINGAPGSMRIAPAGAGGIDRFTFQELHGGASMANIETTGRIRRRVFTSPGNGSPINQAAFQRGSGNFDSALSSGTNVVALWPPNPAGVHPMDVDPPFPQAAPPVGLPGLPVGTIDDTFGIGAGSNPVLTFAELKARYQACEISTSGPGPISFPVGHPCLAFNLDYARKEAREVILASMAGAKIAKGGDGKPLRASVAGTEGLVSPLMLFRSKDWILGDSTLATPAVVTPPLKATPQVHTKEWVLYRDGRRDANKRGIDEISSGFGLRNPDFDDPLPSSPDLKPVKTVVYIGANDAAVHAFSAETSREMWAFVPFDQLVDLPALVNGQITEPHIFGVVSAVRVVDMFVPQPFNLGGVQFDGRWRTVLFFGRGPGGKYYSALDVTSPGPFTRAALDTYLPWVMWNRGNPDTVDGRAPNGTNEIDNSMPPPGTAGPDTAEYATMGECWSVPAVGNIRFVDSDNDLVSDTPEWRLYMGSGCSDTPSEGSSFYIVDALNGDILERTDVGDGPPAIPDAAIVENTLIAPAAGWNPSQMSPPGVPAGADHLTRVFIPDVKGRIFKFNPLTAADGPGGGNANPPPAFRDEGILQPFGNAVALLALGAQGDFVYAESGNDNRVHPFPNTTPPFRMFAFNDPGGDTSFVTPGTTQFTQDFPSPFRGTVQPATVFNDTGSGRVFFAGTALVDGGQTCIFRFDTFLFALGALSGSAVYDFDTNGIADLGTTLQGTKTSGIQVVGGQMLLSDSGEIGRPPTPPPPPGVPPAPAQATPPYVNTTRMSPDSSVCRQ
jgi:hypothetical protein